MTPLQWAIALTVGAGWLYEVVFALWLRWVPTITEVVRERNHEGWMQLLVIAVVVGSAVWALSHLLGD